jgi:hypothetical protein
MDLMTSDTRAGIAPGPCVDASSLLGALCPAEVLRLVQLEVKEMLPAVLEATTVPV